MKIDLKRIQAHMNSAVLYDPAHHVLVMSWYPFTVGLGTVIRRCFCFAEVSRRLYRRLTTPTQTQNHTTYLRYAKCCLVFDVPNRCGKKTQDFITVRQLQEGTSFRIRCVCLGQMFGSENCVTQRIASRSDNIINRLLSAYDGGASCVLHTSHIAFRILPNHQ